MKTVVKQLVIFQVIALICIFILLYNQLDVHKKIYIQKVKMIDNTEGNNEYIIDTPFCKLKKIDPFDDSIKQKIGSAKYVSCFRPNRHILTYANKGRLYVNWTAVNLSTFREQFKHCHTDAIYRPRLTNKSHNFFRYVNRSNPFRTSIDIHDEFIKVQCFNTVGSLIYTNFHIFIQVKPDIEDTCKRRFLENNANSYVTRPLSVLLIGLDSISQLNSLRFLPKTRDIILNQMGGIELMCYNKIDENTFVNIVPLTAGKFVHELPWNTSMKRQHFDIYDFIWNKFSRQGYRTLFAEDWPAVATFDYLKAGFYNSPADYFFRPYSLALWKEKTSWYGQHKKICFNGRTETHDMLQYTLDFTNTFRDKPHFAFTHSAFITHDSVELAATADEIYFKFFKELTRNQNNTFIIFFSDHGMRFGRLRNTYIGKLEERLPMCFIIPPTGFKLKYPTMYKSLVTNSRRLTTHFDIYRTLLHILYLHTPSSYKKDPTTHGISLLTEVPRDRTCSSAKIALHWCTCYTDVSLNTSDDFVIKMSNNFLNILNKEIRNYTNVCDRLKLKQILSAYKIISLKKKGFHRKDLNNNKLDLKTNELFTDVQIVIKTFPGNGIFEGSVRYFITSKSYETLGDISRLDLYGDSSNCVDDARLRKICHCTK